MTGLTPALPTRGGESQQYGRSIKDSHRHGGLTQEATELPNDALEMPKSLKNQWKSMCLAFSLSRFRLALEALKWPP